MTVGRRREYSDTAWFMIGDKLVYKFTLLGLEKRTFLLPTIV